MMFGQLMSLSVALAAICAGLMAGIYFAFSAFIMRAFDQLGAASAAAAMNSINRVILRSWFMPLFFGSTLICAALAVVALVETELGGRWLLFAGGATYVVGMFACTVLFNVPLNDRLARAGNERGARADYWPQYLQRWTRWNHLRGASSLAAMVLLMYYLVING
jgi:uncharacterized membrane protein